LKDEEREAQERKLVSQHPCSGLVSGLAFLWSIDRKSTRSYRKRKPKLKRLGKRKLLR
jgi:hypothetical protein